MNAFPNRSRLISIRLVVDGLEYDDFAELYLLGYLKYLVVVVLVGAVEVEDLAAFKLNLYKLDYLYKSYNKVVEVC